MVLKTPVEMHAYSPQKIHMHVLAHARLCNGEEAALP